MLNEFRHLGMSEADLAQLRERARQQAAAEEEQVFLVWPENADTVELFLIVAGQWRKTVISGMAGAIVVYDGLDYSAVESAVRMHGVPRPRRPELFWGLREMEAAARSVLNER